MVSTRTRVVGEASSSAGIASRPFSLPRCTSRMRTSGACSWRAAVVAATPPASATTSRSRSMSSSTRSPLRTIVWSSAMTTRTAGSSRALTTAPNITGFGRGGAEFRLRGASALVADQAALDYQLARGAHHAERVARHAEPALISLGDRLDLLLVADPAERPLEAQGHARSAGVQPPPDHQIRDA